MGRPRNPNSLGRPLSVRIRTEQDYWLRWLANEQFDGEMGRAVRYALDMAQSFHEVIHDEDPIGTLEMMLAPDAEQSLADAERQYEAWRREQAIKRAQKKAREK